MTVAACRAALLEAFAVPSRVFTSRETGSLNQHRDELTRAANFGMWKSVTLLASQMVEAFLAKRLARDRDPTIAARRLTFGQLIQEAKQNGVLPDYDSPVLGAQSMSATLLIRNWAAHFDLWSEYPTELRATQAIALMLCALESLYPNDDRWRLCPVDDRHRDWRRRPPHHAVEQLEALRQFDPLPASIAAAPDDFCDYVATVGSLRTTVALGDVVSRRHLAIEPLRDALALRFGYLPLHAARANDKYLMRMLALLRRCGLHAQAQVFAILLPFDAQIMTHVMQTRHPLQFAFYVKQCHNAEPALFESKITARGVAGQLVPIFWRELVASTQKVSVISKILQFLPPRFVAQLMAAAPVQLLESRLAETSPRFGAMFLYSMRRDVIAHAPALISVRDTITAAVVSNVRLAPLEQLHNVPVYFRLAKLTAEPFALQVVEAILFRMLHSTPVSNSEWHAVRRAVWDSFIFVPQAATDALGVAHLLLAKYGETNWNLLCLRGMVELTRGCGPSTPRHASSLLASLEIPEDVDRWQVYLALIAAHAISSQNGQALPEHLVVAARTHYDEPPTYALRMSRELVARVAVVLAHSPAA